MARAFLFVLDSFGIGGAPDAARFGDEGADTYGHIAAACAAGAADRPGLRTGPLDLPRLCSLGLEHAAKLATGRAPTGGAGKADPIPGSFFAAAQEVSSGKDTPSGHWEIAGVPVPFEWDYFPRTVPTLPSWLTDELTAQGKLSGILGNRHASGTEIIAELGGEHLRSGKPIVYTSADSVLQIAAHEQAFGLERLFELCVLARRLCDRMNIGRVIARPFAGGEGEGFHRTSNRRDYAVPPPAPTLLDRVKEAGGKTVAVGKIADIFAGRGVCESRKAPDNDGVMDQSLRAMEEARPGDLVFSNFVDFDMMFGHRRDVAGYAAALEAFDRRLPEVLGRLQRGDLLMLTADHGCDPTWSGSDHTRERVPVLGVLAGARGGDAGLRPSFADIGETVAAHLGLGPGAHGRSFLEALGA